ncbi:MAG: hypothetical protein ACK4R9_00695 [Ignavibacterium sp.]
MSSAFYTNLALSKKINIIGKYDFITRIWEGFNVAHKLPGSGHIKVGAFTPSYEVYIDDHTAFTWGCDLGLLFSESAYQGLIYNPFYTEAGVEVGMFGGKFLFTTASVGSNLPSNRTLTKDPTYTARVELTPSLNQFHFSIGGSYAAAKISQTVNIYGGFLGFGHDEFTLLAEYDLGGI